MNHNIPRDQRGESPHVHLNEALRQELLDMGARDQEMRKAILAKYKPGTPLAPEDLAWWESVDTGNTARMKEIVARHGWPGQSLVGDDGANAAWLLVQHADKDVAFQKQCLELLQGAVAAGQASAQDLAYLTDRVRVHEGQPQLYGAQMRLVEGAHVPAPIEDPDRVDERRAAVGLGPLAEYVARFNP